ncbi:Odorant receptor [Camponotus japonicus]
MQILSLNFLIYTIGGVWQPIEWSSNGAKLLYNAFTFIVLVLEYFLTLTQFMDIVLVVDNIDDFVANSLMFVSMIGVCCKATIIVIRRSAIVNLIQVLCNKPCKPQNKDEETIQTKFDEFIRSWSIKYSLLVASSFTGVTIGSVLNVMQGHLPCRIWLPYDINASPLFWIIFIQQILSIFFASVINVGTETLIFGLFLQICAQFEIFESRLRKLVARKTTKCLKYSSIPSDNKRLIISQHIHHHLSIYKYAKMVNIIFNQVLFIQFCGSILVLCTCVYYLSAHITEFESATLVIYTICMFIQIYIYCWSGNEVILKSKNVGDAVYHMDWPLLSVSEKKDLLIIMIRSTIPIKFTSSFLITLSLQSYSNILKTSYSVFNLLQS